MNKEQFLTRLGFPKEWLTLEMYPDELWRIQQAGHKPEHLDASEHDRNGAFHWWLRRVPEKAVLLKLVELTFLDPDQVMASDVREYIKSSKNSDSEVVKRCAGI